MEQQKPGDRPLFYPPDHPMSDNEGLAALAMSALGLSEGQLKAREQMREQLVNLWRLMSTPMPTLKDVLGEKYAQSVTPLGWTNVYYVTFDESEKPHTIATDDQGRLVDDNDPNLRKRISYILDPDGFVIRQTITKMTQERLIRYFEYQAGDSGKTLSHLTVEHYPPAYGERAKKAQQPDTVAETAFDNQGNPSNLFFPYW